MSGPPLDIVEEALADLHAYRTPADPAKVKLDANESPWPLSAHAREHLGKALAALDLHRYPDIRATRLRAALASRLRCDPDELVIGVGSDEVIAILIAALGRPRGGRKRASILFPTPSFVMYAMTSKVQRRDPIAIDLRADFSIDREAMLAAIEAHRPNIVFLASPNNPTGNTFADDDVLAIVRAASDALVVIDEAYAPFAGRSLDALMSAHPNVSMLGTLSKIGMAGVRLGWARVHPTLAAEVEKARQPYNLNAFAQCAAEVLLTDLKDEIDRQIAAIVSERDRVGEALAAIDGVRVFPSQANFFLVEHADDVKAVHAYLLARGIQVRRFADHPRLAGHLRITIGTPDENEALLRALESL